MRRGGVRGRAARGMGSWRDARVQAADRGQQERRDVVEAPAVVPSPDEEDEQANPTVKEALAALRARRVSTSRDGAARPGDWALPAA